jgi:hypothetical protein
MLTQSTNDAQALALAALAATLSDERRAQRFLDLTGLSPNELRARAAEPGLLAATIAFLESHEPDLIAVAEAIGSSPAQLVAAGTALSA